MNPLAEAVLFSRASGLHEIRIRIPCQRYKEWSSRSRIRNCSGPGAKSATVQVLEPNPQLFRSWSQIRNCSGHGAKSATVQALEPDPPLYRSLSQILTYIRGWGKATNILPHHLNDRPRSTLLKFA